MSSLLKRDPLIEESLAVAKARKLAREGGIELILLFTPALLFIVCLSLWLGAEYWMITTTMVCFIGANAVLIIYVKASQEKHEIHLVNMRYLRAFFSRWDVQQSIPVPEEILALFSGIVSHLYQPTGVQVNAKLAHYSHEYKSVNNSQIQLANYLK